MTEDLSSRIADWLEQTGYPLEMRTLKALGRMENWEVRANEYFEDVSTGISREVDLNLFCMSFESPWKPMPVDMEINIVIECKTSAVPWVILKRSTPDDFSLEVDGTPLLDLASSTAAIHWFRTQSGVGHTEFVHAAGDYFARSYPRHGDSGYAVVDGLTKPNSRDGSYDAVRQAVSACINIAAPDYLHFSRFAFSWYFPIVVTNAKLFEATLDLRTDRLSVEEVARTRVLVPHDASESFRVEIFNEAALPDLIQDIETCPAVLEEFIGTCDSDLIAVDPENVFIIQAHPAVVGQNKG